MLTAVWTAAGVVLWTMFPMTATALLPMCCVAPLAWYWVRRRRLPWHMPSLVTVALYLAGLYLLVNASWSLSPTLAARAVALVFVVAAALAIVLHALPELEEEPLRAMAAGAIAALMASAAVLCFEVFSDQSLRRLLIGILPALQPYPHHLTMQGSELARLAPYLTNANIAVLTVMFWPAALMARSLGPRQPVHKWLAIIASIAVAATVFFSDHASSQVAFVGAGLTFVLFRARPKLAMPVVVAGWVAANLLVVPVTAALFSAEAYRAPWLPYSAQQRVVIWGHTSAEIPKAPVFGVGIGTGRALQEAKGGEGIVVPGTSFHLSPATHSHNAYLQVWYETGTVGALILLGLGLLVLRALARYSHDVRSYLAATFSACALLIATSFAIWAPWLIASLGMAAIFAGLSAALAEREAAALSPAVR
jgi:O-antigen ligase